MTRHSEIGPLILVRRLGPEGGLGRARPVDVGGILISSKAVSRDLQTLAARPHASYRTDWFHAMGQIRLNRKSPGLSELGAVAEGMPVIFVRIGFLAPLSW